MATALKQAKLLGPKGDQTVPVLIANTMKTGDIGFLGNEVVVTQVTSRNSFLGEIQEQTLWFSEMNTADVVDGRVLTCETKLFEVLGPKSYTSALGTQRTVMEVAIIELPRAQAEARRRIAEWRRANAPWKVALEAKEPTAEKRVILNARSRVRWTSKPKAAFKPEAIQLTFSRPAAQSVPVLTLACAGEKGQQPLELGEGYYSVAIQAVGSDFTLFIDTQE